jgi:5'-nucleotidase (lipoprotein e(P4) family)
MKKYLVAIVLFLIINTSKAQDSTQTSQACLHSIEELKLISVLWQQDAAEYRALCYQAFNIATMRLNEISKKQFKKGNIAIITDLDETILDNSYEEVQLMKENKTWNFQTWKQWTDLSAATAVPGAVEFLQYAKQKGAAIFYISNRTVSEVSSTLKNLQGLHLPDADTSHMLFLSDESSKESRRQAVMKDHNVVMLLGDNLNDFKNAFETKTIVDRFAETDKAKEEWGQKFIVLPNVTYGEWENALYSYQYNLSSAQQLNLLRALLKGIDKLQQ